MMRLDHLLTYCLSTSRTFNQKVDDSLLILNNFEILGGCWQGSHFPQPFGHIPSHWPVLKFFTLKQIVLYCYSLFTLIVPAFRLFSPSPTVILRASFDSLILHYPLKLYCLYFWLIEFNGSLFWGMNLIILAWPEPQRRIDMRFIYIARKQMTFESEWTKFLVKLFTVWFSNLVFWQSFAASFSSGKNK